MRPTVLDRRPPPPTDPDPFWQLVVLPIVASLAAYAAVTAYGLW